MHWGNRERLRIFKNQFLVLINASAISGESPLQGHGEEIGKEAPNPPSGKDKDTCVRFAPCPEFNAELAAGPRGYGATMERKGYEGGCRSHPTRSKSPWPPPTEAAYFGDCARCLRKCRRRCPSPPPPHAKAIRPSRPHAQYTTADLASGTVSGQKQIDQRSLMF